MLILFKKISLCHRFHYCFSNKVFQSQKSLVENQLKFGTCRSKFASLLAWLSQKQMADGTNGSMGHNYPMGRQAAAKARWSLDIVIAAACSCVPLTQSGRRVFCAISRAAGERPHTDTYHLEELATGGKRNLCSGWHRMDERRRPSISVRKDLKHLASQLK